MRTMSDQTRVIVIILLACWAATRRASGSVGVGSSLSSARVEEETLVLLAETSPLCAVGVFGRVEGASSQMRVDLRASDEAARRV